MDAIKKGRYKHFKGGEYEVLGVARHSETLKIMVVYQPLYELEEGELATWVRPIEMFLDKKTVNGEVIPRFVYIGQ